MLNEKAGIYLCVNLSNGKLYVGSASQGYLYDRYRAHLFTTSKKGSKIVQNAVAKYGITNFAFVVLEFLENKKELILSREQYYIDYLQPVYNILKVAGSVIGLSKTLEQRIKQSLTITAEHKKILSIVHTGKFINEETRNKLREIAINRPPILEKSRELMRKNNFRNKRIIVLEKENNDSIFKTFTSIADAAEFFYNDRNKRSPIK